MPPQVIENPILNSPYTEPARHHLFDDDGITNDVAEGRRPSSYFIPIAQPKKKTKAATLFDTEWTQERVKENDLVNQIRAEVALWRQGGYYGVSRVTRTLLDYWTNPAREKPLFFCQVEALETAIYITEAAPKGGRSWIANRLREANEVSNPGLPRIALKMATGTGKTVVMAMLIAWHTLNKLTDKQDTRFSDTFLVVTPGITIRDRLRVLLPSEPDNYYRQRDLVPSHLMEELGKAKILITNFHGFLLRDTQAASPLTKKILAQGQPSAFTETPDEMVRRVCRDFGNKRNVVVLNDEAHHCYRRKADAEEEALKGDERKEAEKREEEARVWISGLEAVQKKLGIRSVFDLSATPFFLRGSGHPEGTLFPWVVSDFSLIDAIEAGIVKVPRVPISDDSGSTDLPTYRALWANIRDRLPKKGRGTEAVGGEPKLPVELQGALHSLYSNYEKSFAAWDANSEARARGLMPPVFIVVCNNTNTSKLVYDYIAGWEKPIGDEVRVQEGKLAIFRNDDGRGGWLERPNTILVDSEQLESGTAMSDEFKKIVAVEIEEFKADYRRRYPGRDADDLTDEDLLREVMNTVGKPGKLGEHVKCVVSVSMLTEGWDANTVTHILGVRAFGTQLLCEQVVGRALRRISYAVGDDGMFEPEYAEVYGVPFSFIPTSGSGPTPKVPKATTRVRALAERAECEITFPRLLGYRHELKAERLTATFTDKSHMALSTEDIPSWTETAPIIGERAIHRLDDLKRHRPNEVAFLLAKQVLETKLRDPDGGDRPWLFPQVLEITRRWLAECVQLKDGTFLQLLLLIELANDAVDHIFTAMLPPTSDGTTLKPILQPYDTVGSTRYVDFDTTKATFVTHFERCHVSHVALDSGWEATFATHIEDMPELRRYVKNQGMGFTIPYTLNGEQHQYVPDYILCLEDGHGPDDLLNVVVEVSGERKKDKVARVTTAETLWVPAVNNHGGFGRWAFVEVTDPYDAVNTIRSVLRHSERTRGGAQNAA